MKFTDYSYAYDSLTNFEYEAQALTGNGNNMIILKLNWKHSWNKPVDAASRRGIMVVTRILKIAQIESSESNILTDFFIFFLTPSSRVEL